MKSEYNRRIYPNHVRVAPVSAAAQSNPIGAIVANGVGRLANFRKFLEAAQLNSFAGTDVRHNRTLIFRNRQFFVSLTFCATIRVLPLCVNCGRKFLPSRSPLESIMIRTKTILLCIALLVAPLFAASEAQAGPLLDWLRGRRSTSNFQQQPAYNYYGAQAPATAGFTPTAQNALGLQPGQCMKTCQQTCSRTVVNYVPYTAYRTSWKRVPVTTYRPVTNSDPCTGCTVTCMRPCTTYTYQMQRVPYTTQRPVYRTETYKVPVTTITNDCATGGCNTGCSTCATGGSFQGVPTTQGFGPTPAFPPATGGSTFQGGSDFVTPTFPGGEPSSIAPSLNSGGSTSRLQAPRGTLTTAARYNTSRPQVSIPQNLKNEVSRSASASPVQRDWNYSPIRLASYSEPTKAERVTVRSVRKQRPVRNRGEVNSFWKDVK